MKIDTPLTRLEKKHAEEMAALQRENAALRLEASRVNGVKTMLQLEIRDLEQVVSNITNDLVVAKEHLEKLKNTINQ